MAPISPTPKRYADAMHELAAFEAECVRAEASLRAVRDDDWQRPGLGEWTLHQLAVHLTRGAGRLAVYLDQPVDGPPVKDRMSYFQYDPEKIAPGVAARAAQEATELQPADVANTFAAAWRAGVQAAEAGAAGQTMATPFGTMYVAEYVATRVLEMVVHHMDVRRALDLAPDPDPDAGALVVEILEALLEGDRPRNLGRDRFILVATGRLPHDDPRFPVLR